MANRGVRTIKAIVTILKDGKEIKRFEDKVVYIGNFRNGHYQVQYAKLRRKATYVAPNIFKVDL